MRQLKITKSITNRESASLDKYLQEIGKEEMRSGVEQPQGTPLRCYLFHEKKRAAAYIWPCAQTAKNSGGDAGGAEAPPSFIRIRRLCWRSGLLILQVKSIAYKCGRPLVC